MTRKRKVKAQLATLAVLLALAAWNDAQVPTTPPTTTVCMEDMPCWDCNTMGNLVCGPTP